MYIQVGSLRGKNAEFVGLIVFVGWLVGWLVVLGFSGTNVVSEVLHA